MPIMWALTDLVTLSHLMNEVYPREGQAGLMEKQVWMGVSAP